MGGVVSIDLSLANVWKSWYAFRRGKKRSIAFDIFCYHLEENLFHLYQDLNTGRYRHGSYKSFIITDTKTRLISQATLRDKIVHRLLYDYLVQVFDETFIYDA